MLFRSLRQEKVPIRGAKHVEVGFSAGYCRGVDMPVELVAFADLSHAALVLCNLAVALDVRIFFETV